MLPLNNSNRINARWQNTETKLCLYVRYVKVRKAIIQNKAQLPKLEPRIIAITTSANGGTIKANSATIIETTRTPPDTESDTLNNFEFELFGNYTSPLEVTKEMIEDPSAELKKLIALTPELAAEAVN